MATSDSDVHWVNVDSVPVSSSGIDSINCGQVAMMIWTVASVHALAFYG